ncbi:MAG: amidohydrolase, partial [Candidatus Bathyarchaeia archaeon]
MVGLAADLVLLNGKVVTVDPKDTIAEAVAVKGGRIIKVGTSEEVKALVGEETRVIDLEGKTLVPGFIETHCHPALGGTGIFEVDCRSPPIKSIKEILEKIREKTEKTPKGEWVRARNYNENKLIERRHITRWELDQVAPDNPVFISKETGHLYVVNSKALELAGITKDTPDPPGGKIDRSPKTGEATGLLYETASMMVTKIISPYNVEQIKEGLKHVFKQFLEWGLTTVHQATAIPISIKACQELLATGEMPIRLNLMVGTLPGVLPGYEVDVDLLDLLVKLGLKSGFGGERLRIMSVKLIADGSGSGGSAAVYTPQHRGIRGLGILVTSPEELTKQVIKAHKAGLRVSIHAIGDRGIDVALDAIEAALREHPVADMRHRIEHCSVCTPKQQERIKKLGVVPCSSIGYMWGVGDDYIE